MRNRAGAPMHSSLCKKKSTQHVVQPGRAILPRYWACHHSRSSSSSSSSLTSANTACACGLRALHAIPRGQT